MTWRTSVQRVTATFRNGRIELSSPVDWPDGTQVVVPQKQAAAAGADTAPMLAWPEGFFDDIRKDWGDEPFERPPQGDYEKREQW
jgi:hypothetical protein